MSNQRERKMRRFMHGNGKGWKTKGSKSNQQRHAVPVQTMNQHHVKRSDINKVDLHNHGLHQAKNESKKSANTPERTRRSSSVTVSTAAPRFAISFETGSFNRRSTTWRLKAPSGTPIPETPGLTEPNHGAKLPCEKVKGCSRQPQSWSP